MIIILFSEGIELVKIKNKLSEFNLFYKYLMQKRKILINKGKILITLQKIKKQ